MSAARILAVLGVAALFLASPAAAQTKGGAQIIIHAGKAEGVNHQLARQFAEAIAGGDDSLTLDVQESQGSVQNVIDATDLIHVPDNYVFTANPSLLVQARRGEKPFEPNPRFANIRALFPIPFLTMHWMVRQDSGIAKPPDLLGHSFVPGGNGSMSERVTAALLQILGIEKDVRLIDIDATSAATALAGNKVNGMALAGTFPMPAVQELAKATPIHLLSLDAEELRRLLAADDTLAPQVLPKGTYPGVDSDVTTVALAAGAYTTDRMSDDVAYAITKAFWTQKAKLAERSPPWHSVSPADLAVLGASLHAGALRYYAEAGISVPEPVR